MPNEAIIAILVILALIILFIIYKKVQSNRLKNELNDINVRFNALKSVPLAFKLNKATQIAKINEEMQASLEGYREQYDTCQKHLNQLDALIATLEDNIAIRKYKQARESLKVVLENIKDSEEEVKNIETFLDRITKREQEQREHSSSLKEEYRDIRTLAQEKASDLSICYDGVEDRLKVCEERFSSFEEQIYANDFVKAQEDLDFVESELESIKEAIEELPSLVHMANGTLPTLEEEVEREYLLTRQRGVYTNHLSLEERLRALLHDLKAQSDLIEKGQTIGVKDALEEIKAKLESLLVSLNEENEAYDGVKKAHGELNKAIEESAKLYQYIEVVYKKDKEKYSLEDLSDVIANKDKTLKALDERFKELDDVRHVNMTPSTMLLVKYKDEQNSVAKLNSELKTYKQRIDKTSNDENRAKTQIVKLQIVLNEVEVKIAQYRLPAISASYESDLRTARDNINDLKILLAAIPLDVKALNSKLDMTIDYVYKLYNNVNNVVGMALMVENAIVFGNKYRSSYPEVDAELSKAEFAYLNGEYTQSLSIAIACIEKLFPKDGDKKIKEYASA